MLEQLERANHLISLLPESGLDWSPRISAEALSVAGLLGHLLECAAGMCATLYAMKRDELEHFSRLRDLPVNHNCGIREAQDRLSDYATCIKEGFGLIADDDLGLRLPTVFVSEGETALTLILGNLEHLTNHKYQLFFYLKMLGIETGTSDLYRLRGKS